MRNFLRSLLTFGLLALIAACGGGGGGGSHSTGTNAPVTSTPPPPIAPTGDNVQAISVNGGPAGVANLAFTSVTICVSGNPSQCQTVDNVIIDTGSTGLRVLSSALGNLSLPQQVGAPGPAFAECVPFLDGSYAWGPVRVADVRLGGKTAVSVPIQIIAEPTFGTAPSACANNSNPGATPSVIESVGTLGGNGILGVGVFREDCGLDCSFNINNGYYYSCDPANGCTEIAIDPMFQVKNPLALFDSDNNGIIIQLPSVPASGSSSVNGWMIFGIDTRDNNARGSATMLTLDSGAYLNTTYKNKTYAQSFVDSGSNGLFFPDTIAKCSSTDPLSFYCPSSTLNLSATMSGQNGTSAIVNFSVANANALNSSFNAFINLAGTATASFDWGLPFFFGRKVYTAFETNPGGPYIAF